MKGKNLGIKRTWSAIYFFVILSMSIVFAFGQIVIQRNVEDNARQVNYDNAIYMRNYLDDSWSRIYQYSMQLLENSSAKKLEECSDEDAWYSTSFELSKRIIDYTQFNNIIQDIMIFYPRQDKIVGKKGVYRSNTYWAACYPGRDGIEYDTWMNTAFTDRDAGYFTIQNGLQLDLYFRISIPDSTKRVLVAKVDTAEIQNTLQWIRENSNQGFLAVVDDKNTVYAYSGNYEDYIELETNKLKSLVQKSIYTVVNSEIVKLRYVTVVESSEAMYIAYTVRRIAVLALIIALLVGGGVLLVLVSYNAKPIEEIAATLAAREGHSGNELDIIREQISDLIRENSRNIELYQRQQRIVIYRTFLDDSLRFNQPMQRSIEMIASVYGINFESDYFIIIVRERAEGDYSGQINKYLEKYNDDNCAIAWTQKQDLDIFLLNSESDLKSVPYPCDEERWTRFDKFYHDLKYDLSCEKSRIVFSKSFSSIERIREGYLDCLHQLNRKEIVFVADFKYSTADAFGELQTGTAYAAFQNCLIDEDYHGAKQMIPRVCKTLNATELEFNCRKYGILSCLISSKAKFPDSMLQDLEQQNNMSSFSTSLDKTLAWIIQNKHEAYSSDEQQNNVAGKVKQIIEVSYHNPLLGLYLIADMLNLSQSYVSRSFKKQYVIGVSQYINQVRIDHAKRLLCDENISVKEVALMVGFSSDIQFIRAFKRNEGITPGAYRASN